MFTNFNHSTKFRRCDKHLLCYLCERCFSILNALKFCRDLLITPWRYANHLAGLGTCVLEHGICDFPWDLLCQDEHHNQEISIDWVYFWLMHSIAISVDL